MAEYAWGAMAPAKRVAAVQSQIAANDRRRAECLEAHRVKLNEIDETDRRLKGDLRQATGVVEREEREATIAAAAKSMERIMAQMAARGVDVGALVRSGEFEKALGRAVDEAGAPSGRAKGARRAADAARPDGAVAGEPAGATADDR